MAPGAELLDLKVVGNFCTRIVNPTTAVPAKRIAALAGGIGALVRHRPDRAER